MQATSSLRRIAVVSSLLLTLCATVSAAAIPATIDTDEHVATPVPHRYLHGVIPDDAKFQVALPDNWNGKLAIFSRGFSGTELTTGSFKTTALQKGYAFAASDEGWNRLTIANRPQDSYYESRHRNAERVLALYFIPGMGHGGMEYDNLIGAQIDALEQWIDYRKSDGKKGALPPESLGGYSRELVRQGSIDRSNR